MKNKTTLKTGRSLFDGIDFRNYKAKSNEEIIADITRELRETNHSEEEIRSFCEIFK